MEPVGGELLVDRFCEARRTARPPAPAPARTPEARAAAPRPAPASPAPRRPAGPAEPEPSSEPGDVTDTGRLRAEVDAFMNREAVESTDDSEIQEFLKERSGFNPNDLG